MLSCGLFNQEGRRSTPSLSYDKQHTRGEAQAASRARDGGPHRPLGGAGDGLERHLPGHSVRLPPIPMQSSRSS